mmetsp:Transcript_12237/g.18263  ORF Transcript_12237/g.18263 Transcript_12237/m.18263 type:complete len:84 (-) Transcript_12237:65-316(-)
MVKTISANGYVVKPKKRVVKTQKCSDAQAKEDQKLGFGKMLSKGLEACSRKQLTKVAKKHEIKSFGLTTDSLIGELRAKAKTL